MKQVYLAWYANELRLGNSEKAFEIFLTLLEIGVELEDIYIYEVAAHSQEEWED